MKQVASILLFFLGMAAAVVAQVPEKEWTVAVYLNGDNDLDQNAVRDQEEMTSVGSSDWLNIVTLIDRQNGSATLNFIEKGHVQVLEEKGQTDMGDYRVLVDFARQAFTRYPARHTLLVIWSHGMGWLDKSTKRGHFKGISPDDQSGNMITTAEIGTALAEIHGFLGRKIDVLAMDSCYMQMAEVAFEVKDHCSFVVASEEREPGSGFPFDKLIGAMGANAGAREVAEIIVGTYMSSYNGGSQGQKAVTLSALDCSRLDEMYSCLDDLARLLMSGSTTLQIQSALTKAQKIDDNNVDLPDLMANLRHEINDPMIGSAIDRLQKTLSETIISSGATPGTAFARAKGLAIYFPAESFLYNMEYNHLPFNQAHLWNDFLIDFYRKVTVPIILADVESGNVSSLLSYAARAGSDETGVRDDLVTRLNFRVFTEGGLPQSTQDIVRGAVEKMHHANAAM